MDSDEKVGRFIDDIGKEHNKRCHLGIPEIKAVYVSYSFFDDLLSTRRGSHYVFVKDVDIIDGYAVVKAFVLGYRIYKVDDADHPDYIIS